MAKKKKNNRSQRRSQQQAKKEAEQVVTLEFDDGKEMECKIEGVFDVEGEDYIALVPNDHSGDVYIYRYIEKADGDYYFEDESSADKFRRAVLEYESLKGHKRPQQEVPQ
ncbi:MAG: DUF1292 domain-containing protein [Anaerovoracaceae bacterium]|jgi:hypothetical protein